MLTADFLINKLHLREHPEGGFYRELYRSDESIKKESLPGRYDDDRTFFTSIYFLLKSGQVSRFHRLKSDETWYFHSGSPLWIHTLAQDGSYNKIPLGEIGKDHVNFQYTIPR